MKICTIVGARPQFIKAATVSRVIAVTDNIDEIIIHTGQHYDANMSLQFFTEMMIPEPKYNLNIGSGRHGQQTGQMLAAIEDVLLKESPDSVLVYGDTNSTLAGALAAVKLHIPVAHVEAGLRSFNRQMPEEINRIMTDNISEKLFVPTDVARNQLLQEGVSRSKIHQVGDVMLDATLFYNQYNTARRTLVETLALPKKEYILVTLHRAENTDNAQRLLNICQALSELANIYQIILPLHPRTRQVLASSEKLLSLLQQVQIIDPVGYLDMLALERDAIYIITDSGGVQKEAYFNKVPCVTLRDETEWVELVAAGWNRLCSPRSAFSLVPLLDGFHGTQLAPGNLYGDGYAADKIVQLLAD